MPVDSREGEVVYQTYEIDFLGAFWWLVERIREFFGFGDPLATGFLYTDFVALLDIGWNIYAVIALILSALFFYGWLYAYLRLLEFDEEAKKSITEEEKRFRELMSEDGKKDTRREDIAKHIASDNPNDWRVAIVEADILLEEILDKAGYIGTTVGEKLKGVDSAIFKTVQDAWGAHIIRNKIAHEGAGFDLTKRVAQQTILQYERVFDEFGI